MLAASRNDRVIGRSIILTVSIRTRNGFNQAGAPEGSRDAAKYEGEVAMEDIIKASHIGNPRLKVNNRCLVELKTYGRRPIRLVIISIRKRGAKRECEEVMREFSVRDSWSFIIFKVE